MHEAILNPTSVSEQTEGLVAAALRTQTWYGEPLLHPGEDPLDVLAPGTAPLVELDAEAVDADDEEDEEVELVVEAAEDEDEDEPGFHGHDPGASRRYRFRHPTASGKTIAAAGFVEASRHLGILILTHRRLLVSQFTRDLTTEGYSDRFTDALVPGVTAKTDSPITIQTYAWFARHGADLDTT